MTSSVAGAPITASLANSFMPARCTDGVVGGIAYSRFTPLVPHPAASLPLVLVHGAAHTRAIFAAWAMYLAAQGLTVYTLDLRGHGQSPLPPHQTITRVHAADYLADLRMLVAGIDELRDGRFVLLGHSMGGVIVQLYARRFPVAGLIVLASVAPHHTMRAMVGLCCRSPLPMLRALLRGMQAAFGTPKGVRRFLLEADAPDVRVEAVLRQITPESTAVVSELGHLTHLGMRPLQTKHLLFLGAEHDRCFPLAAVRRSALAYGTCAQIIPDAPHDVMLANQTARAAAADAVARFVLACAAGQEVVHAAV